MVTGRREMRPLRAGVVLGLVGLLLTTVCGAWAVGQRLIDGSIHEATTVHVPWGLGVALYIFFLGLSAGCFLISTLPTVFRVRRLEPIVPLALTVSLACLLLAGILILLDLGHPERMYKVLTSMNPSSAMAWMGVLYNLYALVLVGSIYFALRPHLAEAIAGGRGPAGLYRLLTLGRTGLSEADVARDHKWLRGLGRIAIPVIVIVLGFEGSIFSVAKARPNWFGGLFPVVILVSAFASGAALLTFLAALAYRLDRERKLALVRSLAFLTVGAVLFEVVVLLVEVGSVLYGWVPQEADAWLAVLVGPYSPVFWGLEVGVGIILPVLLVAVRRTRRSVGWLGFAGLSAVVGTIGARFTLVVPALVVPVFPNLSESYYHARFALGYWPSVSELLVGLGVFSLGVWIVLAACTILPLRGRAGDGQPEGVK